MGFRKIGDFKDFGICAHPEHEPPGMIVLQPGVYEWKCPGCHKETIVIQRKDASLQDDDTNPMHAFGHGRGD